MWLRGAQSPEFPEGISMGVCFVVNTFFRDSDDFFSTKQPCKAHFNGCLLFFLYKIKWENCWIWSMNCCTSIWAYDFHLHHPKKEKRRKKNGQWWFWVIQSGHSSSFEAFQGGWSWHWLGNCWWVFGYLRARSFQLTRYSYWYSISTYCCLLLKVTKCYSKVAYS